MISMNILEDIVSKKGVPLYIQHNDFMNKGIEIDEEVNNLLHEYHIDIPTAEDMMKHESVWSVQYYHSHNHFELFYDVTLHGVIAKLLHKLES